jgi:hypothetical protein
MKLIPSLAACIPFLLMAVSCEKPATATPAKSAEKNPDIPILPLKKDDFWRYSVRVELPEGVTADGSAEMDVSHERLRRYIGKIIPAEGLPEVDCFEVTAPNTTTEREFVTITDDKILMRGSTLVRPDVTAPLWFEPAVPFVYAGMKAGESLRELRAGSETRVRNLQIVAREDVTVPTGTYPSIRMLMTGMDGGIELRRTLWFAPGIGIVREEKVRYGGGKLLLRETHELVETSLKR